MFKNVLLKTLHEKRWMMLFWCLGVAAMALITMTLYPSFKEGGFDQALQNLPKQLQAIVGNIAENKTVPGYIGQQIFAFRIPLVALVMSVILFSGLIAGDENEGTLQTLLAQPVSRSKVFIQKYLAGMITGLLICLGAVIGILIALMIINERMGFMRLLQATIEVWLLSLVFGTIAFALGAITGKRSIASGVAGLFAFGSYLISSLAANVSSLDPLQKFIPFHYYNQPPTAVFGINTANLLTLAGIIMALLLVSYVVFTRRDIYQR